MHIAKFDLTLQGRQTDRIRFFGKLDVLIHHFPDMLSCSQSLLHRILKPRKLAHRIVATEEKEKKSDKLSDVYAPQPDFAFRKEEERRHEKHTHELNDWGGHSGDTCGAQIRPENSFSNSGKATALTFFPAVSFHNGLICQSLLRGIRQPFVALKRFAGEFPQRGAKLYRQASYRR